MTTEQEWKIAKAAPHCAACQSPFPAGTAYFSTLVQAAGGLERQDFCEACFASRRPPEVFYFWQTAARPPASEKKSRFAPMDAEHVLDFFKRLASESEPQKQAFRYILGLMLARKKTLVTAATKDTPEGRVQMYREKGGGPEHEVLEPELSAEQITAISSELGLLLGLSQPATVSTEGAEAPPPAP